MNEFNNDMQKFFDEFNQLKIKEHNGSTFLEIAKCPHLENTWSNILAFYLNPNNEHNLYELLLESIFESIKSDISINNFKKISVQTEYTTKNGNRIDIIVIADNFILGIENKVEASLDNDLEDYSIAIDDLAKIQQLPTYKIVLSKYKNETSDGFINLTYTDLIKTIKRKIGFYSNYSDTKYLVFFLDFIKNIENNINFNTMSDNIEVMDFLQKNVKKVNRVLEYHNKFNLEFEQKLNGIDAKINTEVIVSQLNDLEQTTALIGAASNKTTGRFTWQEQKLIKYNIIISDISLFFQIGISDYKIHSHYWFAKKTHEPYKKQLEDKGICYKEYGYQETDGEIASSVTEQMKIVVKELSHYSQ